MDHQQKKRSVPQEKKNTANMPEVTYTAPIPIQRRRLILHLLTVAAVVLAVFLGLSVFFRVGHVKVSGNNKYDAWTIREASGIRDGESLLSFGKAKAAGKITQALPYVKSVRIGITLPDTVNIYIEELDVVYAAQDTENNWWLLASDGRIVEKTNATKANETTQLKGFALLNPEAGQQAAAKELEPGTTTSDGEEVIVTITNAERLKTALQIIGQLERNGILGKVAVVDVENMGDIELWYGTQYQVVLGEAGQLEEKIAAMKQAISQMGSHQSGILDITFEEGPNKVGYNPF